MEEERAPYSSGEFDFVSAALAGVAALALYVVTLAPTVSVEDTGELVAAAYTLGIPHPTGYPLWCLIGKLFIVLIPFGDVAWRVNLSSAVFSSGTVFLLAGMAGGLTRNRLAGIAAGLALACSWEFWEQAVIAEVYALNAFAMMLCIVFLFRWEHWRRPRLLYAFALTYGLSLSNHSTAFLLAPIFLVFILEVEPRFWRMGRHYAVMALLVALGLSVYLYLPIRSLTDPPMDWGNPETWQGFWDVFTRKQYQFIITDKPRSWGRFLQQSWVYLKLLGGQFTPWVAPVALFGIVTVWRQDKSRCAFLLFLFFVVSIASILVPNFDLDRMQIWLNTTYWIPAYVVVAFFLGFGIDRIATRLMQGRRRVAVTAVLGPVCVVSPLLANYARCDKSDYYFSRDYALNVFRTMEPDAIYYPFPDHSIFPVLYLHIVEGVRPDVTIANKYGFPEKELYADMPEVMRSRFDRYPNALERAQIQRWIVRHTDRPVYFARKPSLGPLPGKSIVNAGLLYKIVPAREQRASWDGWDEYTWHTLDPSQTHGDWTADLILYDYHFARGRWLMDQGRFDLGVQAFEKALRISREDKEWLNDVASACAEYGLYEAAATYFQRALAQDPDYQVALRNLARVFMRRGRGTDAIPLLERNLAAHPHDARTYWLLAQCLERTGRVEAALSRLEMLTALTPEDPRVFRKLGMFYWKQRNDPVRARELFLRSLRLNPEQPEVAAALDALQ